MISYYFGSKEKLMEAVFEHKMTDMRLKVATLMQDEELSYLKKVNVLIDDYVDRFIDQQEFHKIMLREQCRETDGVVANFILELKKRNLASIKKLIFDGQKTGEFKKHIDVVMMMTTMIGTVSQMITSQRFYREMNNLVDMSEVEFQKYIKKKLSTHLKNLFKLSLTNEL
jgi:AcrR family transcriptional regulator